MSTIMGSVTYPAAARELAGFASGICDDPLGQAIIAFQEAMAAEHVAEAAIARATSRVLYGHPAGPLLRYEVTDRVRALVRPRCLHCLDTGHVCEDHPGYPWEHTSGPVEGHAGHGAVGQPCGYCCSPIPEDGSTSITVAFTPDWQR